MVYGQFNLYDTDRLLDTDMMNFDCLHYYVRSENVDIRFDNSIKQVIKYCVRPIDETNVPLFNNNSIDHRNFTFEQLRYLNITIQQLLLWSASVDLVERYLLYIDQPLLNNSLSYELFYNCTDPWFGTQCQYSFVYDNRESFSLIIENKFHQMKAIKDIRSSVMNLTCYNHLQCDRGGIHICLDWREICDGKIDCMDGGTDEAECFDMEINECKEDEYRCHNGLCIPKDFWHDDETNPDCLDRSDEPNIPSLFYLCFRTPSFLCEEHTCRPGKEDFSCGDGQCVEDFDSCNNGRHYLLKETLLEKHSLSNDCWSYLACFSLVIKSDDETLCDSIMNDPDKKDYLSMCESLFQFPVKYSLLGHVRFFYQNNQSLNYMFQIFKNGELTEKFEDIQSIIKPPSLWTGSNSFMLPSFNLVPLISIGNSIPAFTLNTLNTLNIFNMFSEIGGTPIYVLQNRLNSSFFGPYIFSRGDVLFASYFSILLPDIVCYDQSLCNFLSPTFHHNNLACRYRHELNLTKINDYQQFTLAIKNVFRSCLTTYNTEFNYLFQLQSSLYCCQNSSKRISKHRLMDGIKDCHMGDDETYNFSCSINDKYRFKCNEKKDQCFSPIVDIDICEIHLKDTINNIYFQDFCNGIDDLSNQEINGKIYTDETECEYWPCNNIYTRCDSRWSCSDGQDEDNCIVSECPSRSHPCLSSNNYSLICLSLDKVNNGIIDCLGASDEMKYCLNKRSSLYNGSSFRCKRSDICIPSSYLCDEENDCPLDGDDELFCKGSQSICSDNYNSNRTNNERIICDMFNEKGNHTYFSLKTSFEYPESKIKDSLKFDQQPVEHSQVIRNLQYKSDDFEWIQHCHRGIYARASSDNEKNTFICFCPPNYYGNLCQYQNERVSLTLRFLAIDRRSIYTILVKLIDHNSLINSYEEFTFMSSWGCKIKFNIYLLYSTRPKDLLKNYSVHIDAYDKNTLIYYTSWSLPIPFLFLPVNRLVAQLRLPIQRTIPFHSCNLTCQNGGQCVKYENTNDLFCQCLSNWSGNQCEISSHCNDCSSDSICVGSINNRSICICPSNKVGPRCLLPTNCPLDACQNDGQCVLLDNTISTNNFMCICSDEYYGLNCQYRKNKLTIILNDMEIATHIQVYISTILNQSQPSNLLLVKKLAHKQNIVTFYLSIPYHMVFVKLTNHYYSAVIQQNPTNELITSINSKQRCESTNELFNSSIITLPLIQRVKYYPLLCKEFNKPICFYDEMYMCLCTSEFYPNCFKFDHEAKLTCKKSNYCQNNGLCLQDDPTCPSNVICICSDCYFGTQCQFYAKGFGLTLDDILRYEFQSKLTLSQQKISIKISAIFTIIIFLFGIINGICSCITFQRENLKKVASGLYILASSITSIFTIAIFTIKVWFLVLSQMNIITNRIALHIGCISIEPLLKIFLFIDTWFNACVAIERGMTIFKGIKYHQDTHRKIAKRIVIIIPLIIIVTFLHEPIYRDLFDDEDEQRTWCVTHYNHYLQNYNSTIILIHFLIPYIINLCSALYIIINISRLRSKVQNEQSYFQHVYKQFKKCKHILITPLILVILSSPRLIIALMSTCIKSSRDPWLFLFGYFISFIPSMLVFIIFVLPCDLYRKEFIESLKSRR